MTTFPRPRGASPYIVTVDDLDVALKIVLGANRKYMNAVLDDEASADLHLQSLDNAMKDYKQLKADAEQEVLAAHKRHRSSIAA
jgi:hypothetical protein